METWPIVKLTVEHCVSALIVGGAFAGTAYVYSLMFPNDAVRFWINQMEFSLAIIVPTALGLIFLSSLFRIILDALIKTWRGFPNGKIQWRSGVVLALHPFSLG